jgi:hypothetical protein
VTNGTALNIQFSGGVYGASATSNGVIGISNANGQSGVAGISSATNGYGVFGSSGSGFAVYASGNLKVTGTPFCNGCTAFTNSSDLRLKKDVKPLTGALDQLLQLRGVSFQWKDQQEFAGHAGVQRGFIAPSLEASRLSFGREGPVIH